MESLVTIAANNPKNLTLIVINNGVYGSTGNQNTYAKDLNLVNIAKSSGFKNSYYFEDIDLKEVINSDGTNFIEIKCESGNSQAPIINLTPEFIKNRLMNNI